MHKALRQRQATIGRAQHGRVRHPHIGEADARVIGGHVECPHIFFDFQPRRVGGHQQAGYAARGAIGTAGAAERGAMRRHMHAGDPHFFAIDQPAGHAIAGFRHGAGFHVRGVAAMVRLGQAKGGDAFPGEAAQDEFLLLRRGAKGFEHGHEREIADDGMLVLQIIVQAQALGGKMVADHRHPQIGAILAAIFLRRGKAPVPGLVGADGGFAQQQFPFPPGQAAMFEIGARPFPPMVEKADIVVLVFQRLDLGLDKGVQLGQIGFQIIRQREIHGQSLSLEAGIMRPTPAGCHWRIGEGGGAFLLDLAPNAGPSTGHGNPARH